MTTFTVTNLNDGGAGSLRAAIQAANSAPPDPSNAIDFAVVGTIVLTSGLPSITQATSIVAGSTTTGSAPTVGIDFNGNAGLVFATGSDGSQLVGLSLGNASGNGVTLDASSILLNNNYIGVALDGTALGNAGDGIFVTASSSGNRIGHNPEATILADNMDVASGVISNVISANGGNGISFNGSANNIVVSNRIGTDVDGTTAMANGANGILLTAGSSGNTIGGTVVGYAANPVAGQPNQANDPTGDKGTVAGVYVVPPLGNLVSGNTLDGIRIDTDSQNNVLNGNFIGTTASGNSALGNQGDGVAIIGADNNSLLGCTVIDEPFVYYNVVSGNGGNGIHITNSDNVLVQANFAGIGANNGVMVPNAANGILVDGSSLNTQVGGVIPLGNVISGNGSNGIEVTDTASGFTTFNTFGGVYAFQGAAPNGNNGVLITSTGGNQTVRTNVLSGNVNNGLEISGDASGVTVVPNIMGLNTRGDGIIANGNNGVLITGTAHDNVLGGSDEEQLSVIRQNTFSGNGNYGIEISGAAHNNSVIYSAIGTDIQEIAALPNGAGGILLASTAGGNVIGTVVVETSAAPSPAALVNVISGNNGNGVTLAAGVSGDSVINNWIGLNVEGLPLLPNTGAGIENNGGVNLIHSNAPLGPPVLGVLAGPTFTNWGGSTTLGTPNANLGAVTTATLAFGWLGADTAWLDFNVLNGESAAISAFTNKIGAMNTAQISFDTGAGHAFQAPMTAVAGADGQWITAESPFSNGSYWAYVTEFLGGQTLTPLAPQGSRVAFTVDVPNLDFQVTGGNYLQLDPGGGGVSGSWIQLQTTGSSLSNGTLLGYATDASGNMLDRAGNITTNLAEAVLASIGSVAFDNGVVMQQGAQSIYLPVGQQLHFAIQDANNAIELLTAFQTSGTDTLSVNVSGGFGTLNLLAQVNNLLSQDAALAGSQRSADEPWLYLTNGQTVHVEVQGSAWNDNAVHFVRIDVDSDSGAWSVGGVAYGNTDAFRSAVRANWDPSFTAEGGRGNFQLADNWVVSSGSGLFAPVLATESGDTFVLGTANVDGANHIRIFGQNLFGFEDLRADQNADWDYNDLVVKLTTN